MVSVRNDTFGLFFPQDVNYWASSFWTLFQGSVESAKVSGSDHAHCRAHATAVHHGVVLTPGSIKFKCLIVRCAPSIFLGGVFNFLDQVKISAGCLGIQSFFDEGFCFSVGFLLPTFRKVHGAKMRAFSELYRCLRMSRRSWVYVRMNFFSMGPDGNAYIGSIDAMARLYMLCQYVASIIPPSMWVPSFW